MNLRVAFFNPCPVRISVTTTLFASSSGKRSSNERRQRRWLVVVSSAARPPPKPRYYKNPSRAIEKGGGFYVPGLQGPRLRFFVPVVATVFLALNHGSGGTATAAMARSEGLAIFAAMAVLGTAILDSMKGERHSPNNLKERMYKSTTRSEGLSTDAITWSQSNSLQWACAAVRDLLPGIEIAHFRNNELLFSTQNVVRSSAGVAVERVVKEQRPLYITRSSSLPEEVTMPFLGDGDWSVFIVPTKAEDVVVFASREEISRDSRRWIEVLSERIVV